MCICSDSDENSCLFVSSFLLVSFSLIGDRRSKCQKRVQRAKLLFLVASKVLL